MDSEYGIEMLQAVFAAVAPGSLWPIDVLLRVLFSSIDQASVEKQGMDSRVQTVLKPGSPNSFSFLLKSGRTSAQLPLIFI